ncbi:microfibril-associated glycoprotein 4-like [Anneissia japonica]|uniref:microfibril-associated glycoprotein 4-like n=1 Tax=Anneissia japonica TaxID=1529436 RepID=UPI0014257C8E|nr:microfibril-associated glycoprotein 4-like [Anneissia japonica]
MKCFYKMFYGIGIILKIAVLMSSISVASGIFCSRLRTATLEKPKNWQNSDCMMPGETMLAARARSSIQCSLVCLRHFPECNSIRYDKVSKSCELLTSMMLPKREDKNCMTYGINLSHDCTEILKTSPSSQSGVYAITNNNGTKTWPVYCDMDTDGGGWTVFQKRQFNETDFDRPWLDYKNGFGAMCDFWLGNDLVHQITSSGEYNLRLDIITTTGDVYFATYTSFTVNGESDKYRLKFLELTDGNAGNVLRVEQDEHFSTYDSDNDDNDGSCAKSSTGGWWFSTCHRCLLNGAGIIYFNCHINGVKQLLSSSEMKIKRQC